MSPFERVVKKIEKSDIQLKYKKNWMLGSYMRNEQQLGSDMVEDSFTKI